MSKFVTIFKSGWVPLSRLSRFRWQALGGSHDGSLPAAAVSATPRRGSPTLPLGPANKLHCAHRAMRSSKPPHRLSHLHTDAPQSAQTCSAQPRCTHRAGLERRSRNDAHAITAPPPLLAASAARMSLRSRPTEPFVSGNPGAPPATPTQRHAGPDGPREPSRLRSGPAAAGGLPRTAGDVDGRDLRDGRGGGRLCMPGRQPGDDPSQRAPPSRAQITARTPTHSPPRRRSSSAGHDLLPRLH